MITINFHKSLQPFVAFQKSHILDAASYAELFYSCTCLFPKLDKVFKRIAVRKTRTEEFIFIVNGKVLDIDCLLLQPKETDNIVLCPIIYGNNSSLGMVLLGIALIVMSIYLPGSGAVVMGGISSGAASGAVAITTGASALAAGGSLTLMGSQLLSLGINMIMAGIMASLAKSPKTPDQTSDSSSRTNNNMFGELTNTISTTIPVALNYGLVRNGGQLISGRIRHIKHSKSESVLVGDYI